MAAINKKQNITNGKCNNKYLRPQMIDKAVQAVGMDESETENFEMNFSNGLVTNANHVDVG